MSRFQKIEKMETENVVNYGELKNKSSENMDSNNKPMCTIKSTFVCPVGFYSSTMCVGENTPDANTHYCVPEPISMSPSMTVPMSANMEVNMTPSMSISMSTSMSTSMVPLPMMSPSMTDNMMPNMVSNMMSNVVKN
jgi:hypothetical protein